MDLTYVNSQICWIKYAQKSTEEIRKILNYLSYLLVWQSDTTSPTGIKLKSHIPMCQTENIWHSPITKAWIFVGVENLLGSLI